MTTTSDKILKDIKEKHISPKPRWEFLLKNSAFWFLFVAALFVGALSFAVILSILSGHDWDIYLRLHKTFWQYLLLSLPYLWIVCLVFFSWIAYYDFVHIKGWYHHSVYAVVLGSIALSLFLGILLFYSGIGKRIDYVLDSEMPFYGVININKKSLWCHPEDGLLGGEIIKMREDNPEVMIVKDCHGNEWEIERPMPPPKPFMINIGERIKIIGKEMDQQRFEAEELRHW
jgi:hypothetical protein